MKPLIVGNQQKSKAKGVRYIIPQELMTSIFTKMKGVNGNEIKLLLTLLGNKDNYTLPVKRICELTGMSKTSYYSARSKLIGMGWLSIDRNTNKLNVNINAIIDD